MNYIPRTVGFKAGERNVFFHILTACNLSCSHCYINKEQHGTETLEKETIEKWLKIFAQPGKKSNLILLGGEPTMHPDLSQVVSYAKELGYSVTVDSNGYLFHDFLNKTTSNKVDYLSFSLDGPRPEINDPIRGPGAFEVCTSNLKKAVAMGFQVSVIYTVSKKNIDSLEGMIPLLIDMGVKKFFIQVIGLRGESKIELKTDTSQLETGLQVSKELWNAVVPLVARKAAEAGIHVTYPKVFLEDGEEFQCGGVVAENFFVFPNGRVYQCPLCEDHPIHTYSMIADKLVKNKVLNESNFFQLKIPEGCVMNKLLQPDNLEYDAEGKVKNRISCCLLKQEIG